jgi:preflagellin peptidase FlaK
MVVDATILSVLRLITGAGILTYASYTDIKTRRASNYLWVIMGVIGAVLLLVQYLTIGFDNIWYLVFIPIMILLMYAFFQMRLLFGGADAKALMAIAILVPIQPSLVTSLGTFPIWTSFWPGSWTIFCNSVILFLIIPLSLLIYNLAKRNVQFPHAMLGYKMSVEKAKQTFVWPLERIKDGKRKLSYMPKEFDADEELKAFENLGITEIWVTPKIPFMIPLLVGFIVAFFPGDLLMQLVRTFI